MFMKIFLMMMAVVALAGCGDSHTPSSTATELLSKGNTGATSAAPVVAVPAPQPPVDEQPSQTPRVAEPRVADVVAVPNGRTPTLRIGRESSPTTTEATGDAFDTIRQNAKTMANLDEYFH